MKRILLLALCAVWIGAYTPPACAAPATWSWLRASAGFDVQGQQITAQGRALSAVCPGAWLSYSATSGLSLSATVQRDFANDLTTGTVGGRFLVWSNDRGQVGIGEDLVAYGENVKALGITKDVSARSVVAGSFSAAQSKGRTVLYGIAQASWDQANDVKKLVVGLRWQGIGGASAE